MKLDGLRVAVLATNGFEQIELTEPMRALREAGAKAMIVSPEAGHVQGMNHADKGDVFHVDVHLGEAQPTDYDALLLPGGVKNPDAMRQDERAVTFVRGFFDAGKPVAAICHAPWMLVEANVVRGRRLTSYPSLRTDIRNAGGEWVDEAVVTDHGLVTSRTPDDIPAFVGKMIEEFGEGTHERQATATGSATR